MYHNINVFTCIDVFCEYYATLARIKLYNNGIKCGFRALTPFKMISQAQMGWLKNLFVVQISTNFYKPSLKYEEILFYLDILN